MIKTRLLAIFLLLSTNGALKAQTVAPFKTGDRVAFLGNSITMGGMYHAYIWLYYMTHFPDTRIQFFNAGIGADNVKQMSDRFEDDVLRMKPNIITLTWGMNDTGYFEWYKDDATEIGKKNIAAAKARYAVLEEKLKKASAIKKILILGSPYDETTSSNPKNLFKGKGAAFDELINFQEASGKKNGFGIVDFYHPMLAINQREQAKNPAFSLTPNDRIHPDTDGHLVMTYEFLKTQGLANKVVADVAINARNKRVTISENALVTNVTGTDTEIAFDYLAKSLPYPIDTIPHGNNNKKKQSEALPLIPFMKEFNQELLTVKELKSGNYNFLIDKEIICTYTSQQLAAGVNLAEQSYTPQYQQAIQIRELNEERRDLERRFRMYAFIQFNLLKDKGLLYADNREAMDAVEKAAVKEAFIRGNKDNYMKAQYKSVRDAWQKQIDVLVDQIYTINKPKTHHIQLKLIR